MGESLQHEKLAHNSSSVVCGDKWIFANSKYEHLKNGEWEINRNKLQFNHHSSEVKSWLTKKKNGVCIKRFETDQSIFPLIFFKA